MKLLLKYYFFSVLLIFVSNDKIFSQNKVVDNMAGYYETIRIYTDPDKAIYYSLTLEENRFYLTICKKKNDANSYFEYYDSVSKLKFRTGHDIITLSEPDYEGVYKITKSKLELIVSCNQSIVFSIFDSLNLFTMSGANIIPDSCFFNRYCALNEGATALLPNNRYKWKIWGIHSKEIFLPKKYLKGTNLNNLDTQDKILDWGIFK
jgi:hypothetical protein